MRSKLAAIGATIYLVTFACAAAYPLFDHSTFAGLPAVLLGLPWIDYLPSGWLSGAIALNAQYAQARLGRARSQQRLDRC